MLLLEDSMKSNVRFESTISLARKRTRFLFPFFFLIGDFD